MAQYKRVVQGKQSKIDEIIRLYIEEILLKFDTAIRSLDEASEVYCLFFNVLFISTLKLVYMLPY